jgi:hypothetical protein
MEDVILDKYDVVENWMGQHTRIGDRPLIRKFNTSPLVLSPRPYAIIDY